MTPIKLRSEIILYPGMAAWHFLVVPKKQSAEIKKTFAAKRIGFGSLRVQVTIGKTSWKTSIFPDTKFGCYLLPLKAEVRKKEALAAKDRVAFTLQILLSLETTNRATKKHRRNVGAIQLPESPIPLAR